MVIAANPSKQSIDPWAFRELGLASFGDARLAARVLRLATDLARWDPAPNQGSWLGALALTTDGVPLGLVGQIAWARDADNRGKSARRKP